MWIQNLSNLARLPRPYDFTTKSWYWIIGLLLRQLVMLSYFSSWTLWYFFIPLFRATGRSFCNSRMPSTDKCSLMLLFHILKTFLHRLIFSWLILFLQIKSILFYHLLTNVRNKLFVSCMPLFVVKLFLLCLLDLLLGLGWFLHLSREWMNFDGHFWYQRVSLLE